MKLTYIENIRLPTEKAHGYQIMKTLDAMHRAGFEVELIVADRKNPLGEKDPFEYYGIAHHFSITRVPVIDFLSSVPEWLKASAFALERWSFCRAIRNRLPDFKGDVLYTRDTRTAEVLLESKKPVFIELHDDPRIDPHRWQRLASAISGFVVISDGLRRLLMEKGIEVRKIIVAHDAFDEDEFANLPSHTDARRYLGISEDVFLAVYTGHLFPWKGMDGIAPAFRNILEGCIFAVVGGNPGDITRVKQIAGDTPHVRWIGHVSRPEVRQWLAAADAAVLPTSGKTEIGKTFTSPLKLFEYLAAGLPVIASDVPSSREILDESTAVFYRADVAEDFLRAFGEIEGWTLEKQQSVSQAARQKVQSYSWRIRGKRIVDFIKLLIE
ncbi:MAG: glycosyltransferase family 4 protein [Patescibacteria group bacterium]